MLNLFGEPFAAVSNDGLLTFANIADKRTTKQRLYYANISNDSIFIL